MARITAASLTGEATTSSALVEMLPRFRRNLEAETQAPRTIEQLAESVRRFHEYLPRDRSILRRYGGSADRLPRPRRLLGPWPLPEAGCERRSSRLLPAR